MAEEKPIHLHRSKYPELSYPAVTTYTAAREDEDEIHILEYWRIILARRWTIFAVLLTVVAATLVWTLKQTPVYRASATIQIDRENPNILAFKDVYTVETDGDALRTQFEVLKSRTLARRVIQDLHLDKSPEMQPGKPGVLASAIQTVKGFLPTAPAAVVEPDPMRRMVDGYVRRLTVSQVRLARLATVSFESTDPKLAAQIINAHARAFIEQNYQYKWEATQTASVFLKQQSETLKANLENAEDRLQKYSRENEILFTDEGRNTAMEKLQQLEQQYTAAVADRFQKASYVKIIEDGMQAVPALGTDQLLNTLTAQLAQLKREDAELSTSFGPDYSLRKRKQNQIDQIEKSISEQKSNALQTVRAEFDAAVEREKSFAKAVQDQRDAVVHLNEGIIQYNILKREVDSDRQLYDGLLTRLNEAGVSADLRASNIRIVDAAETPMTPIWPRKTLNLGISMIVGLVLGLGLVFLQEYVDDTIKSVEDVNRHLNVPTLGLVPKMASLESRKGYGYKYFYGNSRKNAKAALTTQPHVDVISHEAPSSLMAEAYRSIRTSILLSSPQHPPKSVLVTSAAPSEGKTVTAVNIAISLTQMGARVVLIDADMRKPRASSVFAMKDSVGLSSVLTGTEALKAAIQPCDIPNLFVIPCGPLPPNPGELIVADGFRQLMGVLPQYFDYIILDSPPVTNVSDSRILASICDATVLVVKALSTSRREAETSLDQLKKAHGRLAGVVLNDVDVHAVGNYYSYYYSKYSYSYSDKNENQSA